MNTQLDTSTKQIPFGASGSGTGLILDKGTGTCTGTALAQTVTINNQAGVITTINLNGLALGVITVTNSFCLSTSNVQATVTVSGSDYCWVTVGPVSTGSFVLNVSPIAATFTNAIGICFAVF